MLGTILIVVVVLIAAILIYAAARPDIYRAQRSAAINATQEQVFELINDLHAWAASSPWGKQSGDAEDP